MTKRDEYWSDMVKSYEESGLAPGLFCRNKGISDSRLRFYRNKFKKESKAVTPAKEALFEPLIITPLPSAKAVFKLVIELPNKIRCELDAADHQHRLILLRELMTLC
ncbi:hypothetical protein TUM19329_36560 (plasmid) [Legionella antarctica]|uniref:Transposase n=1 Tax=Legionella antarctica TaxID=2708020 RepID=A0A6F8T2J6_9GAMM|nr:hypothetical protein [Legionella antarctica]BCA94349.1 hypothetical protein TUM19329_07100 [Legionella antarctica]BCA94380.1 hypothetical protein TUM19329_07410 [Legionella antarctica]BCA96041.1 hypothetical protein TUM19329_24020 [Legionella antarctica]BCA96105.1 hypothetical protein TUM19329_24660 [Legionella antarctica]BCA96281.1 hypothetical protein TUM19329_26420 [Legionella antarctica]